MSFIICTARHHHLYSAASNTDLRETTCRRVQSDAPLARYKEPKETKTELRCILAESARLDVPIDTLSDSDDLYVQQVSHRLRQFT